MADRITLRGLAGRIRDLADSGHFIARRMEPGEVPDSLDENYLCVHERGNVTIHTGRGVRMNSDRVKYAIPLADLAGEVG